MSQEVSQPVLIDEEEQRVEASLRPNTLADFVGQSAIKSELQTMLTAHKNRGEALDHVLFYGPPGLGKTTLAQILATEMGSALRITSGPAIDHQGSLASILTALDAQDIFFIDEVHRLNRVVEEALYPVMEEFKFDMVLGKGAGASSLRLPLERFTLVGATTKAGSLSKPLRDRFGALFRLDFYDQAEITQIVLRSAGLLGTQIDFAGADEIGKRARGTPRVANRLLRRVRDFAEVHRDGSIDLGVAQAGLDSLGIDSLGLDRVDYQVLRVLAQVYAGQAVGVASIAVSMQEDVQTIEELCEPFLMRLGLVVRTRQGRMATKRTYELLGLSAPEGVPGESSREVAGHGNQLGGLGEGPTLN